MRIFYLHKLICLKLLIGKSNEYVLKNEKQEIKLNTFTFVILILS